MLTNKVALVTGGARGIGRGIAKALAEAGAKVMIADLGAEAGQDWSYKLAGQEDLQETCEALGEFGEVQSTTVDVTKADSCTDAVAATVKLFGQLDILVNNAGVVESGPIDEFNETNWDHVFAVNVKGIFLMTKAALPELRKSSEANVLNTASIAGKKGYANMTAYCGSKFAVIGVTQSLALELGPENIRVNALCPGFVGTAMWFDHLRPSSSNAITKEQKDKEFEEEVASMVPLGRSQTVEDMGAGALYLVSAPNVTGVSLVVGGGIEMN